MFLSTALNLNLTSLQLYPPNTRRCRGLSLSLKLDWALDHGGNWKDPTPGLCPRTVKWALGLGIGMFSAPCDATFKPELGTRRAREQKTGQKNHHDIQNVRSSMEENRRFTRCVCSTSKRVERRHLWIKRDFRNVSQMWCGDFVMILSQTKLPF